MQAPGRDALFSRTEETLGPAATYLKPKPAAPRSTQSTPRLLADSALRICECLLAFGYVARAVSCARPCYRVRHGLRRLCRFGVSLFLSSGNRSRCRLAMRAGAGALGCSRAGSPCAELGIDAGLHAVDFNRAWARVSPRRQRGGHHRA